MKNIFMAILSIGFISGSFCSEIVLNLGGENFRAELLENDAARKFLNRLPAENLEFQKYGGFEYYASFPLDADEKNSTSNLKAGGIYYNFDYRALSVVFADKNIAPSKSVQIASIKTGTEKLKNSPNRISASLKKSSRTLVVFYSHSETTANLAKEIAKNSGAEIFRLMLEEPYSASSSVCSAEAESDAEKKFYRKLKSVPDLKNYDTIFVGSPVWSGNLSRPVEGYLKIEGKNFRGKTVIPFCTTWSNGEKNTLKKIEEYTDGANHREGIAQFHGEKADVKTWLKKIGVTAE